MVQCLTENIAAVRPLLTEYSHLMLRVIAEQVNLSRDTVLLIVHKDLKQRNIFAACFVPHFLTDKQKMYPKHCCPDFVETVDNDPNFLKSFVTGDEIWCFMYDQQTKCQSLGWMGLTSERPQKVRQ